MALAPATHGQRTWQEATVQLWEVEEGAGGGAAELDAPAIPRGVMTNPGYPHCSPDPEWPANSVSNRTPVARGLSAGGASSWTLLTASKSPQSTRNPLI